MLGQYGVPHAKVNGTDQEGGRTETVTETVTDTGLETVTDMEVRKGQNGTGNVNMGDRRDR